MPLLMAFTMTIVFTKSINIVNVEGLEHESEYRSDIKHFNPIPLRDLSCQWR
jgi:hypothetical protein